MAVKMRKDNITREEFDQIEKELFEQLKENVQEIRIICPRCEKKLDYVEHGNSYIIKCETSDCINYGVRGI